MCHHRVVASLDTVITGSSVIESPAIVQLRGGPMAYTLRRSPRSRGLRVVIHPDRGVVVSVPPAGRRGWSDPSSRVQAFLVEREAWLRRHLDRQARERARLLALGGLRDGAQLRFRGALHRLRVGPAIPGARRSTVVAKLRPVRPMTITRPPVMYSQP